MAGKKKKKKQEEPPPEGAPEWITTFVDMTSLLVTFFILLLTFSSMEEKVAMKLQSILKSPSGVWQQSRGDLIHQTPQEDFRNPTDPLRGSHKQHSRPPEELVESMEEMGQKDSPDHVAIDLTAIQDGLRITWGEDCTFAPGSAVPTPALVRSLGELGRVLEHYAFLVVVEGHTDDRVVPSVGWDDDVGLSLARARAAADVLLAASNLDVRSIQLAGLGDERPVADNETAVGRRRNRRVEVRILSLSTLRAANIEFVPSGAEGGR